jgi:hypothetical protein
MEGCRGGSSASSALGLGLHADGGTASGAGRDGTGPSDVCDPTAEADQDRGGYRKVGIPRKGALQQPSSLPGDLHPRHRGFGPAKTVKLSVDWPAEHTAERGW